MMNRSKTLRDICKDQGLSEPTIYIDARKDHIRYKLAFYYTSTSSLKRSLAATEMNRVVGVTESYASYSYDGYGNRLPTIIVRFEKRS